MSEGGAVINMDVALCLIRGAAKSGWNLVDPADTSGACKVTTEVYDLLEVGDSKYRLAGICQHDDLLQWKVDKQAALVRLDGVLTEAPLEFHLAYLQVLRDSDVESLVQGLNKWRELHLNCQTNMPASKPTVQELTPSPNKKVCRKLDAQVSDPMEPTA